jgi:hypothetical protein
LLVENRFPAVWQPSVANVEQRELLFDRCRLVRMGTRINNQLDLMAKNEALKAVRVSLITSSSHNRYGWFWRTEFSAFAVVLGTSKPSGVYDHSQF